MDAGFSKGLITPRRGLPLAGYFNPRPNTGVLDDLHVRCVLFREGRVVGGFVVFDVCMLSGEFVATLLARLAAAGFRHGRGLIVSATHTHTAPYMTPLFGTSPDSAYLRQVMEKAVETVLAAEQNLAPAVLRLGSVRDNPLAFNRRYWMKGGGVTTNPGVKNPAIVKPEGPVDREIGVLAVEQEGRVTALLANIVNHTDTVGTSQVSADWPGRMERCIQNALGYDPLVTTLIGCAGNVNHFDVHADAPQGYAYERTWELGRCYAERVVSLLGRLKPLPPGALRRVSRTIAIPYRTLPDDACAAARAVLARVGSGAGGSDLTSEGLASGEGAVARFFAGQTLAYRARCSGRRRLFRLVTLAFGDRFAVTSLPGEPFTEVGLAIKRCSPFKTTWPVSLAMGACGYVPLAACFARGGYETLPVEGGAPREDTADRLIEAACSNLVRAQG
ncbi:MAG: hypothetical protein RBT78_02340 [Kiritimatiellia bacterium]|jgi:hypothetical protein|nr:hypothetical protein [Kiritimatiellia bacterium]